MGDFLARWLNLTLLSRPGDWAIVWIVATVWLLLFHVVMTAWGAMQSPGASIGGAGPGTVASPVASDFSTTGQLAFGGGSDLSAWAGGGTQMWTDGAESKWAEDGWTGNS